MDEYILSEELSIWFGKKKKRQNENTVRLINLVLEDEEMVKVSGNGVKVSGNVMKSICDSKKFCDAQGPITFGQLRSIVKVAKNKRLAKHIGEGGFKAFIRLMPWFIPQIAVAGMFTSGMRALNKILKPTLKETSTYKSWWSRAVMKVFSFAEGDISPSDPFSKIFFISDGLMTLMTEESKLKFAYHISEIAGSRPDDEPVPEFFVENELRIWINQRYLLDPPLGLKTMDSLEDTPNSLSEPENKDTESEESEIDVDLTEIIRNTLHSHINETSFSWDGKYANEVDVPSDSEDEYYYSGIIGYIMQMGSDGEVDNKTMEDMGALKELRTYYEELRDNRVPLTLSKQAKIASDMLIPMFEEFKDKFPKGYMSLVMQGEGTKSISESGYVDMKISYNKKRRVFNESTGPNKLRWIKVKFDSDILVESGNDWSIQINEEVPTTLQVGQKYSISKDTHYSVIKGSDDLKIVIIEDNNYIRIPSPVITQMRKGLNYSKKSGQNCRFTQKLIETKLIHKKDLAKIKSFFNTVKKSVRLNENYKGKPEKDLNYRNWLLNGGDIGRNWIMSK